jgi:hypothetical protein
MWLGVEGGWVLTRFPLFARCVLLPLCVSSLSRRLEPHKVQLDGSAEGSDAEQKQQVHLCPVPLALSTTLVRYPSLSTIITSCCCYCLLLWLLLLPLPLPSPLVVVALVRGTIADSTLPPAVFFCCATRVAPHNHALCYRYTSPGGGHGDPYVAESSHRSCHRGGPPGSLCPPPSPSRSLSHSLTHSRSRSRALSFSVFRAHNDHH